MKLPGILSVVVGSCLSWPLMLSGQAALAPSAAQQVYPDQGYLSSTRYTSRYFGLAVDFPSDVKLAPVPQPVARDGRIQMLHLAGPPPEYPAVSIVAFPLRTKPTAVDGKAILRKGLDQELLYGVEELHGLSKTTLAGHQFFFYETRRGGDQHMALATNLEGYAVLAVVAAGEEKTLKQLEASFQHLTFIPPAKSREYAGADAEEYEGPAISLHRLAHFQADPPANHIDAGKFSGNLYENESLGFTYRIPAGWTLQPEGAVQPAIERSRQRNLDDPWLGPDERELLKVCNRNLFSARAKPAGNNGQLTYDDFGEVTVSAAPAACFAGIKFPASSSDRQAIKDFLLQFGLTHPIVRDMGDAKGFTSNGTVIVFLRGTVAFQVPGDELSRRLSIALAVTSRRGYLLTWFFAAPHDSELRELMDEKVAFEGEPLSKEASAAKPGGGDVPSENLRSVPTAAGPPASETPAQTVPTGAQPENHQASPGTASSSGTGEQPNVAAAPASPAPSLLRPGETIQDQQIKGQPLPQQH
jgi:hypothetical protein